MKRKIKDDGKWRFQLTTSEKKTLQRAQIVVDEAAYILRGSNGGELLATLADGLEALRNLPEKGDNYVEDV